MSYDATVAPGPTAQGPTTTRSGSAAQMVSATTQPPKSSRGAYFAVGGVLLALAGVGVGVAFGVVSDSKESAAATEPVQTTAVDLHSQAKTFATLANVFFVVGGLATAAGIAWGVVSLTSSGGGQDDDEPEVEARLVPGGVLVSGRF